MRTAAALRDQPRAVLSLAGATLAAVMVLSGCVPVDESGPRGSSTSSPRPDVNLDELTRDMVQDTRRGHYGPGEYGSVCDEHDRLLTYRPLTRWARKQAQLDCPNGTAPGADLNTATREDTAP